MRLFLLSLSLFLAASPASPQLGVADSDGKVASGLKEALSVGTTKAVQLTGVENGFWGNPAIKILMPEKLKSLDKGLRMIGQGKQVDDFELSMNRAAEAAAPAAGPIFKKAITGMSFSDAKGILTGGNTAATEYFKRTTAADLSIAFKPVVEEAMGKTGAVQRYESLTKQMQSMPFGGKVPQFDLTSYVVGKSLDGLFLVLGQEEEKIRTNPAAQVTPLLKQVFGGFK